MTNVTTQNWDGVTAPALPSGWTSSGGNIATTTTNPQSGTNDITQTTGTGGIVVEMFNSSDGSSGNQVITSDWYVQSSAVNHYIIGRANAASNPVSFYAAKVQTAAPSTAANMYIVKYVSGVETVIGAPSANHTANLTALSYYRTITRISSNALMTMITVSFQRLSDSLYLQKDGTFAAAFCNTLVGFDPKATMLTTSPGFSGLGWFSATSQTQRIGSDNFVFDQGAALRAATTYYLDASLGSDSNAGTGTGAAAWQTLAKVNSTWVNGGFVPGDTIILAAGQSFTATTGQGGILALYGGVAGYPITIKSASSTNRATINAGDYWGVRVYNTGYVTLQDLILVGSGFNTAGVGTNGGAGSQPTYPAVNGTGIDLQSSSYSGVTYTGVTITNCDVSGFYSGIILRAEPARTGQAADGFALTSVTSCKIHDCLHTAIATYGGNSTNKSGTPFNFYVGDRPHTNFYVGSTEVYNIPGDPNATIWSGVAMQLNNISGGVVEQCCAHDGTSLLAKNTTTNFTNLAAYTSGGGGGIIFLEATNCIIQDCEAYNFTTGLAYDSCGYDLDGGCVSCFIQRCYSHDNYGAGYQSGKYGGSLLSSGATVGCIIRDNVSSNDCQNPLNNASEPQAALFDFNSQTVFINNTIYLGTSTATIKPAGSNSNRAAPTYTLVNNIIYALGAGTSFYFSKSGHGAPTMQGNLYWTTGTPVWTVGGTTYNSLAALQTAGFEVLNGAAVGSLQNPLLSNPSFHTALGIGNLPRTNLSAFDPTTAGVAVIASAGVNPSVATGTAVNNLPTIDLRGSYRTAQNQAVGAVLAAPASGGSSGTGFIMGSLGVGLV